MKNIIDSYLIKCNLIKDVSSNTLNNCNSLLIAFFIAGTNICSIISYFINISNLSIFLMLFIYALTLVNNKKINSSISKFYLFFYVLIYFAFSFIFIPSGFVINYFAHFIVFGCTAYILSDITIEYKMVFKYLQYIYFLYSIYYYFIKRSTFLESDNYWSEQMGYAYSFVPCVYISILFIIYKLYNSKIELIISLFTFIISLYSILSDFATRGALLMVVVGIIFFGLETIKQTKRLIISFLFILLFIVVYVNMDKILEYILLKDPDYNITSLNKLISMYNEGDMSNGRYDLYNNAILFFKHNFIFGNGIGYFESQNNGLYIHQLFLEILCEFGIIGFIMYSVFFVRCLYDYYDENNHISHVFFTFLFIYSFFPLMFSNSLWLFPPFWLFVFFKISYWRKKCRK